MENFNTQKFISIFLGLAILISSITLILSELIDSNSKHNTISNNENNKQNPTEFTKPAFVESPKNLAPYYGTISLDNKSIEPSGNLTEDFASYTALEIVKANPNGPQINEKGEQNILIPDIENISNNFAQNFIPKKNFDTIYNKIDKELESYNFKIINNSSSSISSYLNNFKNIYTEYLIDKNNNINYDNYSLALEALSQLNNDFYKDILNLEVPENFINFHKKFLKILAYQKETISQSQKINNDPLYAYYLLEKSDEKVLNTINEFQKEAEKISNKYLLNQNIGQKNNNTIIGFIQDFAQKLIIPQKAYALFGIPSIVFDPAAVGQLIKQHWNEIRKWLKNLALEILKDQLIHRLVNQVINWVQGGGKPQFITNWKNFLSNASSRGMGEALNQIYPRICQPFRPLIQIAFQQVNTYDKNVSCTLGNIVNNLENFYNTFKYGGWISYGSVLEPQNNFFGALIISRDEVLKKSYEETETSKSDAESSGGFLSMKTCVKQKVVTTIEKQLANLYPLQKGQEMKCGPINKNGFAVAEGACAIVQCEQYENTTPGTLIGNTIGNSIASGPIGKIVNAQEIAALVSALVNSGLQKLIKAGERGLIGLLTDKNEADSNNNSSPTDPCYGAIPGTADYDNCTSLKNNPIYNQNLEESGSIDVLEQARNIFDQLKNAFQANEEWLKIAENVQLKLQIIGGCSYESENSTTTITPLCANLASNACDLYNQIEKTKPLVEQEKTSLSDGMNDVSNIINQINNKPLTIQEANDIQNKLSRYNTISTNKPIERLNSIKELQSKLNISDSSECDKIILP